ncbi:probable cytochrome P450 313a4 [Drosophila montana]|uniref:probable cytochrome P450 313a4 n=1 Tax=Drosophila montana TaxID=40370 RepID=UPI00313CB3FD
MFSIELCISYLLVLWIYFLWKRRKFYQLMLKVPGPMGYPLVGILHRCVGRNALLNEFAVEIEKRGPLWLSWFGPIPMFVVSDPQTIQDILTSPHAINKADIAYSVMEQIVGNGIVVIKDPLWTVHRKNLNPVFAHNVLLSFLPVFNDETALLLQELDALVGKGAQDVYAILKNFTLRITTQTTMGSEIKEDECYSSNSIMTSYENLFEAGTELTISPWLNNRLMSYFYGFVNIVKEENGRIRQRIKMLVDRKLNTDGISDNNNNIFIKRAIDLFKKKVFSYQDVVDECHTFVIAAFETTAMTIGYTLMQLAMYPQYQEKVYEEIKSAFPASGNFEVLYEDLLKLEYLDMVVHESMRLAPLIPIIARQLSQDLKLTNGVVLPKGLHTSISIFHTHRDKNIWGPEAEIYNPENCRAQNLQEKHSYAYIPFSKGKRNCIGWKYGLISLKITLIKLLRNYRFSTSFRAQDLILENNISLKFQNAPFLELERRP